MSIITDALKRAERDREAKELTREQNAQATLEEEIPRPPEVVLDHPKTVGNFEAAGHRFRLEPPMPELSAMSGLKMGQFSAFGSLLSGAEWPWLGGAFVVFVLMLLFPSSRNYFGPVMKAHPVMTRVAQMDLWTPVVVRMSHLNNREILYTLSGITAVGPDRFALVNGHVVEEGDVVDGAKVEKISAQEVVLRIKRKSLTLSLKA